jgi:hypothetical protein
MSLTDHLIASGSHAGLPFRRDCPACRAERLAGRLPSTSLAPGRAAAAVLVGTLATGGLAPAAAAAATPGVDQVTGVQSTTGASVAAVVPTAPPLAPTAPAPAVSTPTPSVSVPTPSVSVPALAPSAPATRQIPAPVPAPAPKPSASPREPQGGGGTGARTLQGRAIAPQVPAPAAGELSPPPARPGHPPARATSSGWLYIVRPDDSLWRIAELMLGKRGTDAQVARLVDRIWRLNAKRIGTGDPSLIMAGQRLLLPRT